VSSCALLLVMINIVPYEFYCGMIHEYYITNVSHFIVNRYHSDKK